MNELIWIGNSKKIIAKSEKAICLEIGRSYNGKIITTWYPKSMVRIKYNRNGYDLFAPEWVNFKRNCRIGSFDMPDDNQNRAESRSYPGYNHFPE